MLKILSVTFRRETTLFPQTSNRTSGQHSFGLSRKTTASDLIDHSYYAQQTGTHFSDRIQAYSHFKKYGQAAGLNPSPFFFTRWYLWQNPEATVWPSVLDHFARFGTLSLLEPAPFIDSVSFLQTHKQYPSMVEALAAMAQGKEISVSPHLDDHWAALRKSQHSLRQSIRAQYVRRSPSHRRRLVWVQAGPRFIATRQLGLEDARRWDLMCNWYSYDVRDIPDDCPGEIHLLQPGTKATGIDHVLRHDPSLLERYDMLLFLDDDLFFSPGAIDRLFDIAGNEGFDLFQAALLPGSNGSWLDLYRKKGQS
ncbi:MAG: hypothetical protein J5861_04800, partial [Desulfovibrio sp.]|nr:hypothetical protein [Desulfovibrio sp.]